MDFSFSEQAIKHCLKFGVDNSLLCSQLFIIYLIKNTVKTVILLQSVFFV